MKNKRLVIVVLFFLVVTLVSVRLFFDSAKAEDVTINATVPSICGNTVIEAGEDCEGVNLNGATCVTQGFVAGDLSCVACGFDTSACNNDGGGGGGDPVCGNNVIEAEESCDGLALGGQTCITRGFVGGDLACAANCTFDENSCLLPPDPPVCGNGAIEAEESCDGLALGGQTCVTRGFVGGDLACAANCTFDENSCLLPPDPPVCGNGAIEAEESCDGAALGGQTCVTRGFVGGNLVCAGNCSFDETNCNGVLPPVAVCGDNVKEGGEQCDGIDLNGQSCMALGFVGGNLTCAANCLFNLNNCQGIDGPPGGKVCGNSIVEFGEQCDRGNLNGQSCLSQGFDGGALTCDVNCIFNLNNCRGVVPPGDGGGNDDDDGDGDDGGEQEFVRSDLGFVLAQGTIPASLVGDSLYSLTGDQVRMFFKKDNFNGHDIKSVELFFAGRQFNFELDGQGNYYVDFDMPAPKEYQAVVLVKYDEDKEERINFFINSLSFARVTGTDVGGSLNGATIILYVKNNGVFNIWPGGNYRQNNPFITGQNGLYGYVVPIGVYKIRVVKEGYREYENFSFPVNNYVINKNLELIKKAKKFEEVIDPDAPVSENVINILENTREKIVEQGEVVKQVTVNSIEKVQELANNPVVENVTKKVVVPSVAAVSAVAIIPFLWNIILPFFRFLFLQPLLLFGRRKRKAWGVVYNGLTKMPIDLATVRLLNFETKKIVQSKVTDKNGRYIFIVDPGKYFLQVVKHGFIFPTKVLFDIKADGDFLDIYHGEEVVVENSKTVVSANIPLDPIGVEKTPKRVVWEKRLRIAQHVISLFGILTTFISFYITPTWFVALFLLLHVFLYILFITYVKPKKPKGWGIVYDRVSKKPINKVLARLFSKQYNRLVSTQLTDSGGRYAFLVGPNDYLLTFVKPGYKEDRREVDLKKEDGVVGEDVALERQ